MQQRLSRVREHLRVEHIGDDVRLELYGVPVDRERNRNMRRYELRRHVQRRLSQLRRHLRVEHRHRELRIELHGLPGQDDRDRDL